MNRYFYYLFAINLIVNTVASVPGILYQNKSSAIFSITLSLIIGTIFSYFIAHFFNQFPGRDLPDILKQYTSKWVSAPFLIGLAIIWYILGLNILINFSLALKAFLTPDMPFLLIVVILLLFITFGILMDSKHVLYTVEIIFILCLPLFLLLLGRLYLSDGAEWDFVGKSIMFSDYSANYSSISASLFLFLGPMHLMIFNRVFKKKQKMTFFQVVPLFIAGAVVSLTTFFIPIAYNGYIGINKIVDPWLLTTDSITFGFPILERVMHIFLILNLATSFLMIVITWHITLKIFSGIFKFKRLKWKEKNGSPYVFCVLFWVVSISIMSNISESKLNKYTTNFYNIIPILVVVFVIVGWSIIRRAKREITPKV